MKLVVKLNLFFILMLSLSLAGAMFSIWSVRQANNQIERMNLATDSYQQHLSLANHSYQLFKIYGDTLIENDSESGADKAYFIEQIRADITDIRNTIAAEIELVGDEEIEELAALSKIEMKIEALITVFKQQSDKKSFDLFVNNWAQLSRSLGTELDKDFRSLIEAALAEEAEEVQEAREVTSELLTLYQYMASGFALIALLAAIAGFYTMQKQFSNPVERLLVGVRKFSNGEMDHRIRFNGNDEMAEIGETFDEMATRVSQKAAKLAALNTKLEKSVSDRTQQLENLLKDSKRSETNRRRMLADVSHELRTPLTIIRGEADIALRGNEKTLDDYREALTRTRDAATHTSRLVDDLLFVARTESKEVRLALQNVELKEVLYETLNGFGKIVPLLTDLDKAPISVDIGRLKQAILILIENAHHYGGNEVILRLDKTPDGYRITVEDNGAGMSDSDKKSAFERFFRGSNAAEHYTEGTGLGLPVALSIAKAHGGEIALEDRPEGGLIAIMTLPTKPKLKAVS